MQLARLYPVIRFTISKHCVTDCSNVYYSECHRRESIRIYITAAVGVLKYSLMNKTTKWLCVAMS